MSSDSFYSDLEAFHSFEGFAEFSEYAPLPEDWVILAGDIRGSTEAIRQGRYKSVNMLGAAVITAVVNACEGIEVPFVFGGDGGAVAVPGSVSVAAASSLSALQHHAEKTFGLGLRAAAVPVRRLRQEGHDVAVRRLHLNGRTHLAMFSGGGIERVDAILKGQADDPDLIRSAPGNLDLEGLSCRWEPLAARHGRMIALMVQPAVQEDVQAVYRETLDRIRGVLDGEILPHAPARAETMRFRWPPRGLALEANLRTIGGGLRMMHWLWAAVTSAVQSWCHWRGARGRRLPRHAISRPTPGTDRFPEVRRLPANGA